MTDPGGLGVEGKGKAPHFRLTEDEWPGGRNGNTWMLPTKDYLKWDGTPFQDNRGAVSRARKRKQNPGVQMHPTSPGKWGANAPHIRRTRWGTNAPHI